MQCLKDILLLCWNALKIWFQQILCFVLQREEKGKNDNWNFWFWVLGVQKWPLLIVFVFWFAETLFDSVLGGGARFLSQVAKKAFLDPNLEILLIDNWKAGISVYLLLFHSFLRIVCYLSLFLFFYFFCEVSLVVFVGCFSFIRQKNLFSPKGAFLLVIQCLPLFLPSFFSLSLFTLSFFGFSLSLSLSCSFLSLFLPCFLSLCFAFLIFLLFFLCLVSLLLFH